MLSAGPGATETCSVYSSTGKSSLALRLKYNMAHVIRPATRAVITHMITSMLTDTWLCLSFSSDTGTSTRFRVGTEAMSGTTLTAVTASGADSGMGNWLSRHIGTITSPHTSQTVAPGMSISPQRGQGMPPSADSWARETTIGLTVSSSVTAGSAASGLPLEWQAPGGCRTPDIPPRGLAASRRISCNDIAYRLVRLPGTGPMAPQFPLQLANIVTFREFAARPSWL